MESLIDGLKHWHRREAIPDSQAPLVGRANFHGTWSTNLLHVSITGSQSAKDGLQFLDERCSMCWGSMVCGELAVSMFLLGRAHTGQHRLYIPHIRFRDDLHKA
jgi:hypothetical protein